jgi:hypothetical protein
LKWRHQGDHAAPLTENALNQGQSPYFSGDAKNPDTIPPRDVWARGGMENPVLPV